MLIRSVSGVRGLVANELTPELARRYGRAFGETAAGTVAVGWDSRRGGEVLTDAVVAGLARAGRDVVRLGVVPTPTVGLIVRRHGFGGGVVVTASHNPERYNGLKFFSARGVFLSAPEVRRLFDAVDHRADDAGNSGAGSAPDAANARVDDPIGEHIEAVCESPLVDSDAVSEARPRIVVDCVNGAGSVILPRLLRRLGCDVVELFTKAGEGFPRGAEPVPEHLSALSRAVSENAAAAGLACDPDADRLAIVDETGAPLGEELTLAAASRVVLGTGRRGPLVVNVSTSRMMDDLSEEFGVPIYRTAIGEINVVTKMMEVDAVIGGEGNGGVILPEVHLGRDAATAAALVATSLSAGGARPASALAASFRPYVIVKRKLELPSLSRKAIAEAMISEFSGTEPDLTDGAKMAWPDRWVHARMSGTEPVVRVIAEALSKTDALRLVERAVSAVSNAAGGA